MYYNDNPYTNFSNINLKKGILRFGTQLSSAMSASDDLGLYTRGTSLYFWNGTSEQQIGGTTVDKGVVTIPMSFQTSEQTTTKIYFPMGVTINKIRSIVMLAIAGTNAGTITGANTTGASTGGVVTVAASSTLNTEDSATPTTNNTVAADSFYKLTSAKTTAGGKVLVTLEYTIT